MADVSGSYVLTESSRQANIEVSLHDLCDQNDCSVSYKGKRNKSRARECVRPVLQVVGDEVRYAWFGAVARSRLKCVSSYERQYAKNAFG